MAKDISTILEGLKEPKIKEGYVQNTDIATRTIMGAASDFLSEGAKFQIKGGYDTPINDDTKQETTIIPMMLCISENGAVFQASANIFSGRGTAVYEDGTTEKISPTILAKAKEIDEAKLVWRDLCGCALNEVADTLMATNPEQWYKVVAVRDYKDREGRDKSCYAIVYAD